MVHTCHAKGCKQTCPPRYLMCGRHWSMVPAKIQHKVYKHYRSFQEVDMQVTDKWLKWSQRAIDAVAKKEGK